MNLVQLQYFVELAESGQLTKTAKKLYIAQPTLSNAIKALESELGYSLFIRNNRNFTLSENGEIFYRYVSQALATLNEGIHLSKNPSKSLSPTIRLGAQQSVRREYVQVVMRAFMDYLDADIDISIAYNDYTSLMEMLNDSELDACITLQESTCPSHICQKSGHYSLVAVVNKAHPLARRDAVSIYELEMEKLISYHAATPIALQLKPILEKHRIQCEKTCEDEATLCEELQARPNCVALMRSSSELTEHSDLVALPISEISEEVFGTYFITRKPPFRTEVIENFVDFVLSLSFPSTESINYLQQQQ